MYDNFKVSRSELFNNLGDSSLRAAKEVILWRAVIYNAFEEAAHRGSSNSEHGVRWKVYSRQARVWLTGLSEDFCAVCEYADYSPDYIRRKAREMEARGWPRPDYHPQYT